MAKFKPGFCVYCGTGLVRPMRDKRHTNTARRCDTVDHVYPLGGARTHAHNVNPRQPLNKVRSCEGCNDAKGDMHPLKWLTTLQRDDCATALASLLIQLGEDATKVAAAMNERTIPYDDPMQAL